MKVVFDCCQAANGMPIRSDPSISSRISEESKDLMENIAQCLVSILESEATTFIGICQIKSHKIR